MRFSVIIPLYNKAPYVQKALESALSQTFKDFELVVVDDGSSDESFNIAQETLKLSSVEYQLIHQDNAGVSTARNNGVSVSHGDNICFLDADDWWEPNFLERMDWLIREYPEAGIYGTNYHIISRGKSRIALHIPKTGYINYCDCYRKLQMPLWTGSVSIPRKVYLETGGFKPHLKLGEDFDVWVRIALKYKVAYLDEPLSHYYQDSDPSWRLVGKLHAPQYHILWSLDDLFEEEAVNQDYKRLIDELRVYNLLPYYISSQYHDSAKKELAKVDWSKQPKTIRDLYKKPLPILRIRQIVLKYGSNIKQWFIKYL